MSFVSFTSSWACLFSCVILSNCNCICITNSLVSVSSDCCGSNNSSCDWFVSLDWFVSVVCSCFEDWSISFSCRISAFIWEGSGGVDCGVLLLISSDWLNLLTKDFWFSIDLFRTSVVCLSDCIFSSFSLSSVIFLFASMRFFSSLSFSWLFFLSLKKIIEFRFEKKYECAANLFRALSYLFGKIFLNFWHLFI